MEPHRHPSTMDTHDIRDKMLVPNGVRYRGVPLYSLYLYYTENNKYLQCTFSGFSVDFCIDQEKVINLSSENNLPTFRLNAPVILTTTGVFSQIIGKLFSELKLVTDNLLFIHNVHALIFWGSEFPKQRESLHLFKATSEAVSAWEMRSLRNMSVMHSVM